MIRYSEQKKKQENMPAICTSGFPIREETEKII